MSLPFLHLGQISYLNIWPFFYFLKKDKLSFPLKFKEDHPACLNNLLLKKEIDLAPASAFEYLLHSEHYFLLPNLSISAFREVRSVLFCSPVSLDELNDYLIHKGNKVYLTKASASSINLLLVLWHFYWKLPKVDFIFKEPGTIPEDSPFIEIGDFALKIFIQRKKDFFVYDLAEQWFEFTHLPFVFALWIVHKDALSKKEVILNLKEKLDLYKKELFLRIDELLDNVKGDIDKKEILNYWKVMNYDLNKEHKASLILFSHFLTQLKIIPGIPSLKFL